MKKNVIFFFPLSILNSVSFNLIIIEYIYFYISIVYGIQKLMLNAEVGWISHHAYMRIKFRCFEPDVYIVKQGLKGINIVLSYSSL